MCSPPTLEGAVAQQECSPRCAVGVGGVSSPASSLSAAALLWLPPEARVAQQLQDYAARSSRNERAVCELEPQAFAEQVLLGKLGRAAVDGGDSAQPLFRKVGGVWRLGGLEVLYRFRSADGVPFPSFVNFVRAASDQSAEPCDRLRASFRSHAMRSLRRVDARLSLLDSEMRHAMASAGLLTTLNFTAKQLQTAVAQPLHNPELLGLEETEYDDEPAALSEVRRSAWQKFGMLALDDVHPTLAEVQAHAPAQFTYEPPRTPAGGAFKPWPAEYRHDLAFARRFVADFACTRATCPRAKASLKLSEEFCCYLIGVGYAPFSRQCMSAWRKAHPEASAAVRAAGLELISEAIDAGIGICFEVSFDDSDVEWLLKAIPALENHMSKQGGMSGSIALPYSLVERDILALPGMPGNCD